MPKGVYVNPPIRWTDELREEFVAFVPGHVESEIVEHMAPLIGFTPTVAQIAAAKVRFGVKSGTHGGRFAKGHESHNKGRSWDEYMPKESQEACRRGQFKRGNVSGRAAQLEAEVGAERVNDDGYIDVKVLGGRGNWRRNWKPKHVVVWEQANGREVPKGHIVRFRDGDKRNFDPANLALVSKADNALLNKYNIGGSCDLDVALALIRLKREVYAAENSKVCAECGKAFVADNKNLKRCKECRKKNHYRGRRKNV